VALGLADDARERIDAECEATYFAGRGMPSAGELLENVRDADGLLGSAQLPVTAQVIAAAPRLRVVSNFGVGFDNVDLAAANERRIVVCNTPGVLSDAVADLTLGMILSLARRIPQSERLVREGNWKPESGMPLGRDLAGKTLGIVGLGRIGLAVARRAQAFDMRIVFYDQFREPPAEAAYCEYRDLDDLLRDADFVSLHVNLGPESRHLMGAGQFALMKPTAYFVNTSRGQTVDQAALVAALEQGQIAGAALDVLEHEPPSPDEPILSAPNVILLPHVGSATVQTRVAMRDLAIDNLLLALRGERPKAVVNPEVLD